MDSGPVCNSLSAVALWDLFTGLIGSVFYGSAEQWLRMDGVLKIDRQFAYFGEIHTPACKLVSCELGGPCSGMVYLCRKKWSLAVVGEVVIDMKQPHRWMR